MQQIMMVVVVVLAEPFFRVWGCVGIWGDPTVGALPRSAP